MAWFCSKLKIISLKNLRRLTSYIALITHRQLNYLPGYSQEKNFFKYYFDLNLPDLGGIGF